ncbi:MAG: hypothetical protein IPK27_12925 [Rhodanobacteraceae bacterium]|nr:hypothetical protein [Rhodanobacteraceae bacterium]
MGFSEYKIAPLRESTGLLAAPKVWKGARKSRAVNPANFHGAPGFRSFWAIRSSHAPLQGVRLQATIPLKKTIFYRQVFDALFQDQDLSKSGAFERKKRSDLDVEDFHKALRSLAMVCMKSGKAQYSLEEFHELLLASARLVVGVAIDAASFKEDLLTAVPLFVRDGQEVRWAHKSFQDYFISQFVTYDLGERQMDFVRKLLLTSNATKHVEMLSFVRKLIWEYFGAPFIRSYVLELRDGFGAQSSSRPILPCIT